MDDSISTRGEGVPMFQTQTPTVPVPVSVSVPVPVLLNSSWDSVIIHGAGQGIQAMSTFPHHQDLKSHV